MLSVRDKCSTLSYYFQTDFFPQQQQIHCYRIPYKLVDAVFFISNGRGSTNGPGAVFLSVLITVMMCLCFVPLLSSAVQHLKMPVKLPEYNYPRDLKELAKAGMEDSEYLSPASRQRLPSVK